ncbi:hypothetical protein BC938DRAFT_477999 [Jimgerdemannia flammicorona]|uniref:Cytochrome P450 n=1 Tax=Jimgerdemannia flammicorona TaxID=994334 RepID=A0A433QNJ6_9FUNG|nr:hypothetical protein BC938DRAFT_477999 [Jimgerdemannia flammicorona]
MANLIPNIIFGSHLDVTSTQILGCGISLAVALYLAQRWMDGNKQSSPLVPYRFPIIGSTFEWNANPAKFIKDATKNYGSVFRIYANGRVQTVVGKDLVRNVAVNDDFNVIEAVHDDFDLDYMLRGGKQLDLKLPKLITKHITPNLKAYTPRVVRKLNESMDNWLGGVQDYTTMEDPAIMIQDMVANASASVFVGEELCNNKTFIHTSKVLTSDVGNMMSKMGLIKLMPRLSTLYQRHACPGRFFAVQEIKTIVSILIRKYRIVRPTPAVSRSIKINPKGPLMFIKRE